jgi:hypothetical protein
MSDFIIYLFVTLGTIILLALIFSLPVMLLWNWLMPVIFGLAKITWLQALGLSVLSGFLFKGSNSKN